MNTPLQPKTITSALTDNLAAIKARFSDTPDLVIRELVIKQTGQHAAVVYLSSISDYQLIYNHVLHPLLFEEGNFQEGSVFVSLGQIQTANQWTQIETAILNGECVLLLDQEREVYIFNTTNFPKKSLEDTPIESTLTGAHIGFTENRNDNVALIRNQIHNKELKIKEMTIGKRGKLKLSIIYLEDVASPDILHELEHRISHLQVDSVINSGSLAEYIEDQPYSPFPQLYLTERPDYAAMEILQGRIVTVVDRSPNVIVGPAVFDTFFKSIDDYSSRWMVASFIRIMRYFGFFTAIFLPAFYIATISFHVDIIPLKLLISIGVSRERIAFPPFIEAFIMEITLEMLREAGVRLPAKIGQTVGIVSGIVIGQAAVEAGIVSNIMVIVVALTAIASFIIPSYEMGAAIRILRFPMMIAASFFGFVGLIVGLMTLLAHFVALESLGAPYSSPMAPLRWRDWNDLFLRFPLWSIKKRPTSAKPLQKQKTGDNRPEDGDTT